MKKWVIYVAAHKSLYDEMYKNDPEFSNEHFVIMNLGSMDQLNNAEKYRVIKQTELENYAPLAPYWAESEGLWNVWKSGIYKEYDYVGCIHYDHELRLQKKKLIPSHNTNITQRINRYIEKRDTGHISFETYGTKEDYDQRILLDESQPNTLTGTGINCYEAIIKDYNTFFHTNYTLEDYMKKKRINLCSCFLIDRGNFDKMMQWFNWIVETKRLDGFDTNHEYRFQGGMAERYFGVYMLFAYDKFLELPLIHHWNDGLKNQ